jgi:hypothetical protein
VSRGSRGFAVAAAVAVVEMWLRRGRRGSHVSSRGRHTETTVGMGRPAGQVVGSWSTLYLSYRIVQRSSRRRVEAESAQFRLL